MNNFLIISKEKRDIELAIKEKVKEEIEREEIDLKEEDLNELIGKVNITSLFNNKKVFIIYNSNSIDEAKKEDIAELKKYLENCNPDYYLFFISDVKVKTLSKLVTEIKLKPSTIEEYISVNGYNVSKELIKELKEYSTDLESSIKIIEVLTTYKDKPTSSDLELFYTKPINDNIFNLVNAIVANDKKKVFKLYNEYKEQNINIDYLYSLLITKFQELYNLKVLSRYYKKEELADILKVSPGKMYYMLKDISNLTLEVITTKLKQLNKLESDIKKGLIKSDIGIELFLLNN